jgi:hypothetical protein
MVDKPEGEGLQESRLGTTIRPNKVVDILGAARINFP